MAAGDDPSGRLVVATNVVWHQGGVTRSQRLTLGATVWFTGLSGSGKSSVAVELEHLLVERQRPAYLLDGDNLRHGITSDLGFSAEDRTENIRRVGEVARLFADAGVVALVPVISPYRADRERARTIHTAAGLPFLEVYVATSLEVCEQRDPKGLYAKARAGEIRGFTGIDDPYEEPLQPDLTLRPEDGPPANQARRVLALLDNQGSLPRTSGSGTTGT